MSTEEAPPPKPRHTEPTYTDLGQATKNLTITSVGITEEQGQYSDTEKGQKCEEKPRYVV